MSSQFEPDWQRVTSTQDFVEKVKDYIDRKIGETRAGVTGAQFQGVSDADLIFELLARGYAVWKPKE